MGVPCGVCLSIPVGHLLFCIIEAMRAIRYLILKSYLVKLNDRICSILPKLQRSRINTTVSKSIVHEDLMLLHMNHGRIVLQRAGRPRGYVYFLTDE
jgi:hypothetical protein